MDVNVGGFSIKATNTMLHTTSSKSIPITVSGSYTDGEGKSHGVTLSGSLPVTDGHFLGYSDNANGMLSSGYAKGHELYGKSSTVQPRSYTVNFFVRAK